MHVRYLGSPLLGGFTVLNNVRNDKVLSTGIWRDTYIKCLLKRLRSIAKSFHILGLECNNK